MPKSVKERLLEKYTKDEVTDCWNWFGGFRPKGYGMISVNSKSKAAHRVSYELFKGEIPVNNVVMHKCDNPSCINPDHLEIGTHKDNMRDMVNKGRQNKLYGSSHNQAKLTEEDAVIIRNMYSQGNIMYKDLAKLYNTHISTIGRIIQNKLWRHI